MDEQPKNENNPGAGTPPAATEPRGLSKPPAAKPRTTAFEALSSSERNSDYRERRRGWIREHSSDDGFLIFVGVVFVLVMLGLVGYKVISDLRRPPAGPEAPVPLAAIFNASEAEEGPAGTITAKYDFSLASNSAELREACPQMADWQVPGGTVSKVEGEGPDANKGVLVNGRFCRYIPYFVPGDLSVECDAALIFGTDIALRLNCIETGRLDDGYGFELHAAKEEGGEATAFIVEYRNGDQVRFSQPAKLPPLEARRNPPLFYRLKFELSAGALRGFFQGREVCQMPVGEALPGSVLLLGPNSQTTFDNVTIVGRPHPEFVKPRTEMYRLFRAPAAGGQGN